MIQVLLIDSDPDIHKVLKNILKPFKYTVFSAFNAHEGLNLTRKNFPDIIVQEIELPDKSGITLLKLLKSREIAKDIPILVLSKLRKRDVIVESLRAGGVDYILKPFKGDTLIAKLNNVWKHVQNVRQEKSTSTRNPISIKRNGFHTIFLFPSMITELTLEKFNEIYTDRFKKITSNEEYIIDLRNQSLLGEKKINLILTILEKLQDKNPILVAGKNYASFVKSDSINYDQIFISFEDAENFLRKKEGYGKRNHNA